MQPWQWAATAGAVILALGAGVYALNQPRPATTDYAYNDAASPGPEPYMGAGGGQSDVGQSGVESSDIRPLSENVDAVPPVETSAPPASSAQRAAARQTRPAPQPVIEQTIGVGPSGVSPSENAAVRDAGYGDDEEVVVQGRRTLRPQWVRTPSDHRLSAAYPRRALERGREGEAQVACIVESGGSLDCDSISEYPANAGFGAAAERVARSFRHAETRVDGAPAAGTAVNFRVIFRMEDDPRRRA